MTGEALGAMQMHHSQITGLLHYGRQPNHFQNLIPTQQDAMAMFSIQFHHYFQLSPETFPYFYQSFMGTERPAQSTYQPSMPTTRPALLYGKGLANQETVLLQHLQQYLQVELPSEEPLPTATTPALPTTMQLTSQPTSLPTSVLPTSMPTSVQPTSMPSSALPTSMPSSALPTSMPTSAQPTSMPTSMRLLEIEPFPLGTRPTPPQYPLVQIMREFLGDASAQFRTPQQQIALYYMLKGTPNLTIILPTAGGKSTLFLVAASVSWAKTSVIMVPLISLKENLLLRAIEYGVPCTIWENRRGETSPTSLVLVSVEAIEKSDFLVWVQKLVANQQLDRIVFDEVHMIPISRHFRGPMNHLWQLSKIQTQKVYITATLTDYMQQQLITMLSLPVHLTIRANINQPKIHYSVRTFQRSRDDYFEELWQFIQDFDPEQPPAPRYASGTTPPPPSILSSTSMPTSVQPTSMPSSTSTRLPKVLVKVIIYFQYRNDVQKFFEKYDGLVAPYYSDLEGKEGHLTSFINSEKKILATTTALSAGFDFIGIFLVIHYMTAYTITGFIHESGRLCRRPHQVGHSVIYTDSYTIHRQVQSQKPDMDKILMQEYLQLDGCRRAYLNRIFNNQLDQFCGPGNMPCDFCHGRQLVLQYSSRLPTIQSQKQADREACLQRYIEYFQDHCIACTLSQGPIFYKYTPEGWKWEGNNHLPGQECPNIDHYHEHIKKLFKYSRNQQKPADNSCHFPCWLPTRFCKQWFSDGTSPDTNGPGCPRYNPIIAWVGLLELYKAWEVIPKEYQPKRDGSATGSSMIWPWNRQQYLKWVYQVDYDFFNTEVLQGVLAFYTWASAAEEERWYYDYE
jgi:superfamily II DNA helicase RecQ